MLDYVFYRIDKMSFRGAWMRGVKEYALEFVEHLQEMETNNEIRCVELLQYDGYLMECLMNGARSWQEYSYGGSALIYNEDIALRLCNNTELNKTYKGQKNPNKYENWLDVQVRALMQAYKLLREIIQEAIKLGDKVHDIV